MTMRSTVLLLVLCVSAHADTLILRDGTRVTGRWWATDGSVISFLVNDHLVRYSRSDVLEVVFGAEPAANSAPALAAPAPDKRYDPIGGAPADEAAERRESWAGALSIGS